MISVVVPTIAGREHWLERCLAAYRRHGGELEIIVVRDAPACGVAWQEGAEQARGEYVHFSADDLEPFAGWWQAAVATVDAGFVPAPRILNADGTLQSCGEWAVLQDDGAQTDMTRIPFLSRAQWDLVAPMIPLHYYTDNWVSHRARSHGVETRVVHAYAFVHHFAPEGRGAGMGSDADRMWHDLALYQEYVSGARVP
jgi:hypothetical protein